MQKPNRFYAGLRIFAMILAVSASCTVTAGSHSELAAASSAVNTAEIDRIVQSAMAEQSIPGASIAITFKGELRYAKGYGKADIENDVPAAANTVFAIASVSKPILALGIARLVEKGKLRFDDPISKLIPGTPPSWSDVRLTHLLSHTAGIIRESPAFDPETHKPDLDVIAASFSAPLNSPTGTKWEYCNVCYFALAEIITRVSGRPWPQFMQEEVFQPLGMRDTRTTNVRDIVPRRASPYGWQNSRLYRAREFVALRPSGAFLSTALDLARLEAAIWSHKVVTAETLKTIETPVRLSNGEPAKVSKETLYGLGWFIEATDGPRRIHHGGSLPGFRTQYSRYPDQGWAIIVLTNSESARPAAVEQAVAKQVLGH